MSHVSRRKLLMSGAAATALATLAAPSVPRAKGLRERLSCAGNVSPLSLWVQYIAIMCAIPVLRVFPSDIIVCVFRKK